MKLPEIPPEASVRRFLIRAGLHIGRHLTDGLLLSRALPTASLFGASLLVVGVVGEIILV